MMGFGFGGLGMIIFWVAILIGAVYLVKHLVSQGRPRQEASSPMEILKTRYASGEISKDEINQLKHELKRT